MAGASFGYGCVLHWKDFVFSNGEKKKNKYLVILGCKQGCDYLAVLATSKQHWRKMNHGCNYDDGYYFIPGTGKDFFVKDTWLLLNSPQALDAGEAIKLGLTGTLTIEATLRVDLANAIRNCLIKCDDVSEYMRGLVK